MKPRAALLAVWLLCQTCALIAAVWQLAAAIAGSDRAWRIALGYDRMGNAVAGGDDGEYISSRCWRHRAEQPYRTLRAAIDQVAAWAGQAGHCEASYQGEAARAKARAASEPH